MANGNITGLLGNPMFMAGMGLLSGSQPGGDPWGGLVSGLSQSQQNQLALDEKRREEEMRRAMLQFFAGDQGQAGTTPQTAALAQTRPAGLLGPDVSGAARQPVPQPPITELPGGAAPAPQLGDPGYIPTDADIEATPGVWVGGDPNIPTMAQNTVEQTAAVTPATEGQVQGVLEQQQQQGQPNVWDTGTGLAGGDPQQAMRMFGLLAQYGDPQKAAEGYLNYQMAQQRLQYQSQARSSGFNIQWDNQNRGWFPHRDPVTGKTTLTPAMTSEGKQIERDPNWRFYEGAGGLTGVQTTGLGGQGIGAGPAGGPQQIISPLTAGAGAGAEQAALDAAALRQNWGGFSGSIAQERQRILEFRQHAASDMMTDPLKRGAYNLGTSLPLVGESIAMATGGADWEARRDQLLGGTFIRGIQAVKSQAGGIGPISEIEGAKMEATIGRLKTAVDAESFNAALDDLLMSLYLIEKEYFEKMQTGLPNPASYDDTFGDTYNPNYELPQGGAAIPATTATEDERAAYERITGQKLE